MECIYWNKNIKFKWSCIIQFSIHNTPDELYFNFEWSNYFYLILIVVLSIYLNEIPYLLKQWNEYSELY